MSLYLGDTVIAPNISNAANKSLSNLDASGQNIINGKADVDLTNINNTGKIAIAHNAMPSNTYIDLTVGASDTTYTAPSDGYVYVGGNTNANAFCYFSLYNVNNGLTNMASAYSSGLYFRGFIPIKKASTFSIGYVNFTFDVARFYYMVGSESEAS